eukprot:392324_1
MSAFILWANKTACYYWIASIVLLIIMLYYVVSAIFYLLFVHRHQKQLQKQELLTNLNSDLSVQFQRFRLWVAGHANRIIFVLLACSDMSLEIFTTSISSDGYNIVNKPGSVLTLSCAANAYFRFTFYILSNFVFSLFSWYKCELVYTSMQPSKSIGKCVPLLVKLILWYIVFTYPILLIWGCFELHSSFWIESNGEKLCYLYFPATLFGICFAHDLMLFVLLLILFMVPLGYQHKRAKRVETFGKKKPQNISDSYDQYTSYCNYNIPKDSKINVEQNVEKPIFSGFYNNNSPSNPESIFKSGPSKALKQTANDVIVTDELQAAMIRNGIAGSCATLAATLFLTAFYFASWDISSKKYNENSNVYLNEERLWTSGFMVMGNFVRYLVLYICMTVTYKEWKTMLFPWRCCKDDPKIHSNSTGYVDRYIAFH